jgi:hypothetical protein
VVERDQTRGVCVGIPVFLSRAAPHRISQSQFLVALCGHLRERGIEPRTVGETDFGMVGLDAIRGLMMQSNGLISVAFRRTIVHSGEDRPDSDIPLDRTQRMALQNDTWLTTPWCHMETAMSYQLGLPILVLVEKGVRLDGILEAGVLVQYPPQFDADSGTSDLEGFLDNREKWRQLAATWEGQVREVVRNRARPAALYGAV